MVFPYPVIGQAYSFPAFARGRRQGRVYVHNRLFSIRTSRALLRNLSQDRVDCFRQVERADIDAVEQAYAPDVEYWINVMPEIQGLDAILDMVRLFTVKVKGLHYEVEAREFFPGGLVQRCKITGELASGEALAVPLCLVIHVENGRIVRLYEYIDAASIMPLFA